ncbi:MAG: hypothetical protein WKH64_18730 [Chloroflexia bacterium]
MGVGFGVYPGGDGGTLMGEHPGERLRRASGATRGRTTCARRQPIDELHRHVSATVSAGGAGSMLRARSSANSTTTPAMTTAS